MKYYVYSVLYSDEKILLCKKNLYSSFYCSSPSAKQLDDRPMQYNAFPVNTAGKLVFVGGGMTQYNNPLVEAARELFEELGVRIDLDGGRIEKYKPGNNDITFVIKKFPIPELNHLMDECGKQVNGKNKFINATLMPNPSQRYKYGEIRPYTNILDDEIESIGDWKKSDTDGLIKMFNKQGGTDWFARDFLKNLI